MKPMEELNTLKEAFIALNEKAAELPEEELKQVSGGASLVYCRVCEKMMPKVHNCSGTVVKLQ